MTSKELVNHLCFEYNTKNYNEKRLKAAQELKKDLEVLEIIKKNPDIVSYCICYEDAYEMIIDRPGFMINYSYIEIEKQFNKVKEFLKNV